MEFYEKLQELRKNKGLTQEELAEALYVSRTAVSKWESGRGYPSIDSLKEISEYFSVTIDELLSGERLLSIAEKENKSNIKNICDMLLGMVDPNPVNGYIYSVNLFAYFGTTLFNRQIYWIMFIALIIAGITKILMTYFRIAKGRKVVNGASMGLSILTVLFLAMTREAYAVTVVFLLLIIKGALLLRYVKADN